MRKVQFERIITLRVSDELMHDLKTLAKKNNISVSELIRFIIDEKLKWKPIPR